MVSNDPTVPARNDPDRHARSEVGRLAHLDDVKDRFKVADGNPDVRGWDVITYDGQKLGEVEDLLVDTGLRKVRYLETKVDTELLGRDDEQWMLIPIGMGRIDDEKDEVWLNARLEDVRAMPVHHHHPLTPDDPHPSPMPSGEPAANRSDAGREDEDDVHGRELFDEGRFLGNRERSHDNSQTRQRYVVPIAVDDRRDAR